MLKPRWPEWKESLLLYRADRRPSCARTQEKDRVSSPLQSDDMPRPSLEHTVRSAVDAYIAAALTMSAKEAPLNVLAVAHQTGFDRKTLKKYGLDVEITSAAKRQARNGKSSPREIAQRSQADVLRSRDNEIAALRARCEGLVARLCIAEGNAQRLGIDPVELWKPLPSPDRSVPHAGGARKRGIN